MFSGAGSGFTGAMGTLFSSTILGCFRYASLMSLYHSNVCLADCAWNVYVTSFSFPFFPGSPCTMSNPDVSSAANASSCVVGKIIPFTSSNGISPLAFPLSKSSFDRAYANFSPVTTM